MRPLVNLANEPFQNRRLLWLAIVLLIAVPSLLGVQALRSIATLRSQISERTARVGVLEVQLKKFEQPAQSKVTISSEKNRQLYAASKLRDRRAFSWSQLLNDIERNLPGAVRVRRVDVAQIQAQERDGTAAEKDTGATLLLEVTGKSAQDVTTMIDKFHRTGLFKVSPVSMKPLEGTEEVEYSLKVDYSPPRAETKPALNNQIAEKKQ
jgi:Tfp pilus assembly protein PilN